MTGKERLEKLLNGEKVDRMPISPFVFHCNVYEMFDYVPDINNHLLPEDFDLAGKYENYMCKKVHEKGAYVVYHNCGDAQKVMHLYNEMDMDVWGYVTTAPFGDVVLDDALATIRPDTALRGNIDQVEFLRTATPAQVKERVKQLLDKVKSRGNWILSTSDFPFDGQPYENLHAFTEAGLAYGQYS